MAGHFAGEVPVVTGGDEVIEKILVGDGLIALDGAGELMIVSRLAKAPQGGLDGHEEQIGFTGGKAPESDGAGFGDFGVRRTVFVRQDAERRKPGDAAAGFAGDGAIKIADGIEKGFSALVGIEEDDQRAAELGEGERDGESFRGVGEAAETDFAGGTANGVESVLQSRVTGDASEQLADLREDHAGSWAMRSRRSLVE